LIITLFSKRKTICECKLNFTHCN